jgi:hypothetical protein
MTRASRRWLFAAVALLALVAVLVAWRAIQTERGIDAAEPVATTTPLAEQGLQGGTLVSPSNTLGAPVPEPATDDHADGSPIDAWWRRVPPVAGDLVPIAPIDGIASGHGRSASGNVRIARAGEHLLVRITDLRVASSDTELPEVRVVLSEGTVVGARPGLWTGHEDDDDLGTIPSDVGTITFDLEAPRGIPDPVRSLVLLDPDSGAVLGGAALLPTD